MKKIGLIGVVAIIAVIVLAIFSAGQMGHTSKARLRGKVILDDSLVNAAQGIRTLFVTVYDQNQPMPYGAQRTILSADPQGELYEFALTNESVQRMSPDLPWPETMRVKARLDRDGSGGPDQPGDLVGELSNVAVGTQDVVLKIEKVVE
jgi:hypothetical protein